MVHFTDLQEAIDYMSRQARVIPDSIGLIGVSLGANFILFMAAFSPKVHKLSTALWAQVEDLLKIAILKRFSRGSQTSLCPLGYNQHMIMHYTS